jgi:regulator of sirC expression with transglutaminase-like and TPR domain
MAKALEGYLKIAPNAPSAEDIRKQLKDLEAMSVATQW